MHGTQQITSSQVIGKSGSPVLVMAVEVTNDGTAAGKVSLYNGTSATGTPYFEALGTVSQTTGILEYPSTEGIYFPNGCFVNLGTHLTGASIGYKHTYTG